MAVKFSRLTGYSPKPPLIGKTYGHRNMAIGKWSKHDEKTPRLFLRVFTCFRLFSTVFVFFRSFSHFGGCLFLTVFGRPFSHFSAPLACCHCGCNINPLPLRFLTVWCYGFEGRDCPGPSTSALSSWRYVRVFAASVFVLLSGYLSAAG